MIFYFSGTGNSRYIARQFAARMGMGCHSIEETLDFDCLIADAEVVAFCYPTYGGCVPRVMRDFATAHKNALAEKKLILFCTQMMFSGDGARVFTDLLPGSRERVVYAEHFNMPNNICNFWLFPIREGERRRKRKAADKKLERVCADLRRGVVKKRGWCKASHWLGLTQSAFFPAVEEKKRGSFQADEDCTRCGLCVKQCPVKNLELTQTGVRQNNNCILCYRCVNLCPQKAATAMLHSKPKTQYKGMEQTGTI